MVVLYLICTNYYQSKLFSIDITVNTFYMDLINRLSLLIVIQSISVLKSNFIIEASH